MTTIRELTVGLMPGERGLVLTVARLANDGKDAEEIMSETRLPHYQLREIVSAPNFGPLCAAMRGES